ncbi:hypothetical protein INT43_005414 [Umbelopsis isabellina]|uniref:Uncharacterized protein n=1 Tax=Mortierella isabellina TaxID=91625 RepID=A0A8H7U8M6_MORIS|nr:hypothetical protein INT43_005414 [Umbelopsis isabellina]
MDKFYQPYSIQSSRRWSRNNFSDEDDTIFRMSDTDSGPFRSHRRSSSSSSSSQKMSIDTDEKVKSNNGRWKPSSFMPVGDHAGTTARRPSMIRCNSDTQISFNSVSNSRNNSEDAMSETSSNDGSSTVITPARRRKSFSGSHSPTSSMFAQERSFAGGPERRSVTRRGSLLPKGRQLARIMNQLEEESRSADFDIQHEHEITQNIRKSSTMETDNAKIEVRVLEMQMWCHDKIKNLKAFIFVFSNVVPQQFNVPAAAWAKGKDIEASPSMSPYQCSKLNPEMEMTYDALPSPTGTSVRHIKRKASEDRFDQNQQFNSSNFKRRAVSPSVSLTGSPVLSGIGSPPPSTFMMYSSSPTSNAAARAQQKPGQFPSSMFNLHEASGGLSKMSLSEE